MKEFIKKHPIYFTCIAIAAFFIFVLFVAACCNHCYVNSNIRKNIDSLSVNFENTKTNIEIITKNISHECTQDKDAENVSQKLELLCSNIKDTISEIIQLYQKTFDANTVTFLVTFLSALFFSAFLTYIIQTSQQHRTLESKNDELGYKIKEAEDKIAKVDTQIKEVDTQIKEVDTQIKEVDTQIKEVDAKTKEVDDKIVKTDAQIQEVNAKTKEVDDKIVKTDAQIKEVDAKTKEVDDKIAEVEKDWNTKLQYQEYLLKVATERNSLTQVLSMVSVLGFQLASSGYIIKEEYITLAYMIFRKTQFVLKEGFKDIKDIRPEDKTEFMQIITDCITYLSIETLENKNPQKGLPMFTLLYKDLKGIRKKIENIQSHT